MVEAAEPSDGIVALEAVTAMFETVVVVGGGVTGVGVTNA
jgi:glycerol-3-phosphate dehydrogenase